MKKISTILLIIAVFIHVIIGDEIIKFDIFATTDIHGNLYYQNSGIIPISLLLEKYGRDENSILLDCGDLIQGSAINRLEQGELIIQAINLLNYTIIVPGNHDFDFGYKQMRKVFSQSTAKILMANLNISQFNSQPYCIIERQGVKLGFIGLTERNLQYRILPNSELNFIDNDLALRNAIKALIRENADVIILLMHDGIYFKGGSLYEIIKKFPMIDIVIGGHSHKAESGTNIRKSYFAQAGAFGNKLLHITVEFDKINRTTRRIYSQLHDTKELKDFNIPDKFKDIYKQWQSLKEKANEKLIIDSKYFQPHLSLQENLSLTTMKNFCNDGDVYLNILSHKVDKNYDINNLNMYAIKKILYYEDRFVAVELNQSDLRLIMQEVQSLAKKLNNNILKVEKPCKDGNSKIKLVTTEYILSGMGNPNSKIRNLCK